MRSILSIIIMILALGFLSCEKENNPPQALFSIDPSFGDDETVFYFDGSGSSDMEDPVEELLVKWDWEGDDFFDTQYATKKTANHIFGDPGEYLIKMIVKDTRGLTDTLEQVLTVASSNSPPGSPENPLPINETVDLGVTVYVSWECFDPDGDYMLYTVYFGTESSPVEYLSNYSQNSFDPGKLEYGTTYYWKIKARDSEGNITEGPVWNFSTIDLKFSTLTDSRDGKTYSTIEIGSTWWMAENLNFETEDGSYCSRDDPDECLIYGRLYTWEAAMEACPDGWHLPSKAEFEALEEHLGGPEIAGGKLKDYESRKWKDPNTGATNISGFGALPGGRRYDEEIFSGAGYYAQFFSSTEFNEKEAFSLNLAYDYEKTFIYNYKKKYSVSVRCLKD